MNARLVKWLTTLALALAVASPVIAADDEAEEFEKRIKRLNTMAEKPAKVKVALQRIATETGMPLEQVQNQHKKFPEIGVAGLMVANVLGNDTRKNPGQFLSQRQSGKRWLAIAKENKVPIERINERLERLEKAIKGDT
jgi:hypothetical protein